MVCLALLAAPAAVYVWPGGRDSNPGTSARPLATLDAAVSLARSRHVHRIVAMEGTYALRKTLSLDARDSGLTIEGRGVGVLTGSLEIPPTSIKVCRDEAVLNRIIDSDARSSVRMVDLAALGVDRPAPIEGRGFPHPPHPAPNELFDNGVPMTVARWPNEGYAKVEKVIEPGNGETDRDKASRRPVFTVGERAKLWAHAEDPWFYGYWKYDWADESIPSHAVDDNGVVTLEHPHVYGVAAGADFFVENLMEELDSPGEYYIDRPHAKLYFIPPQGNPKAGYELSVLSGPIISVKAASHLAIQGLTLKCSRGDGIQISDSKDVKVEHCALVSLGERGVAIQSSFRCGLKNCMISDTGEGGVSLSGGDRRTLTPGDNFVEASELRRYERLSQTYRPAVLISGDGNRVSHCMIHDAPHSAIIFAGNDHLIEYNEFFRTISRTGDGGVVYTGRDWSARGTVIRYNWFHDDVGQRKWEPAIYIDDLGSGIQAYGNLIERCHWGFLIGGGRDNLVENNVLIDCDLAFDCDARGLGWGKTMLPTLTANLQAVPYQSEPWRSRYPSLVNILSQEPLAPAGNVVRRNLLIRSGPVDRQMEAAFKKTAVLAGNYATDMMPPRAFLEDPANPIWRHLPGFKPLPVREMGRRGP